MRSLPTMIVILSAYSLGISFMEDSVPMLLSSCSTIQILGPWIATYQGMSIYRDRSRDAGLGSRSTYSRHLWTGKIV